MHVAALKNGREVVVKILRPGMREIIDLDLEVLHYLAELADQYWVEARRLRPVDLVREYRKTILDELDLLREAGNASQLKRNFAGSPLLYVPEVHWDYCRVNVMVMERIHGVIVSDVEELRARGTNIRKLAENGVEIFFTQVFRDNFFHADMHPGNIFVQIDDPQNPRYAAVDFGIVGTLQPRDQHYLAENFMAFFDRDYARVAALHVESGWVPRGTRVDELETAVRTVCEPIFNKPLKEISFAQVLLRLFETARRFDMQVQPQLILLQKTLFNIEGLGRQLYPELDLWQTAQPYLRKWMRARTQPPGHAAANSRPLARYTDGAAAGAAGVPHRRARCGAGRPAVAAGRRRRGAVARGNAAQRLAPGCRHRGGRAVAVGIGLAGVCDANSLVGMVADDGGHRALRLVAVFQAARQMRIPIESSTSYRGRNARPNWLILAAFIARGLGRRSAGRAILPRRVGGGESLVCPAGEAALGAAQ